MIEVGREFCTIAENVCWNCHKPIHLALYLDGTEQWFHDDGGWEFCRHQTAAPSPPNQGDAE